MIHIARKKDRLHLSCYKKRKQKGLKRFQYRYKDELLSDAEYEAKIALDHYNDDANYQLIDGQRQLTSKAKKFDFWVYKSKAIRNELKRIFRGKCAYCEYEIAIRADFDIEHFRPKKAVGHSTTGDLREPGYYWLAADWHNLMPSCPYCNQERTHEIAGKSGTFTLGKKNQFPLSDESKRLSHPNQKIEEEEKYRLLINPCVDTPEDHLYFVTHNDNKELGFIKPVLRGGELDPRGEASIIVYALNTKALVDKRHQHAADVIKLLQRLTDKARQYHEAVKKKSEFADDFLGDLQNIIEDLRDMLHPSAMFLGLTRQIIRDYDNRNAFAALKQLGIDPIEMVRKSIEATNQL
jgi:uncharacterized protein (TIGR02646 family)